MLLMIDNILETYSKLDLGFLAVSSTYIFRVKKFRKESKYYGRWFYNAPIVVMILIGITAVGYVLLRTILFMLNHIIG